MKRRKRYWDLPKTESKIIEKTSRGITCIAIEPQENMFQHSSKNKQKKKA